MWRMPIMNLCFLLVLITVLALQHSAAVFAPTETLYEATDDDRGSQKVQSNPTLTRRLSIAVGYLSDLAQRSRIIKEWNLEYNTASWERLRAAPGAESDLVDARFHVANAEVFGVATGNKQRAQTELDRADRCLRNALGAVASDMQPTVRAIQTELMDAKAELEMDYSDSDIIDEQIKIDLDWLLHALHDHRL
jgi:hypothetical protein